MTSLLDFQIDEISDDQIDEEPARGVVRRSESSYFQKKMIKLTESSSKKTQMNDLKWIDSINSFFNDLKPRNKKAESFNQEPQSNRLLFEK